MLKILKEVPYLRSSCKKKKKKSNKACVLNNNHSTTSSTPTPPTPTHLWHPQGPLGTLDATLTTGIYWLLLNHSINSFLCSFGSLSHCKVKKHTHTHTHSEPWGHSIGMQTVDLILSRGFTCYPWDLSQQHCGPAECVRVSESACMRGVFVKT